MRPQVIQQKAETRAGARASAWDDYLKSMEAQFKGTDYMSLFQNNPYSQMYKDYSPGLLDSLGSIFGFQTRGDALKQSALEYNAQLLQNKREEGYNSESSVAQRMREAGLNPDLTGLAGGSQASEFDMPQTPPGGPDASSVGNVVSGIASAIEGAIGLFGKFQNLKSLVLENDEREFSLTGSASGLVRDYADAVFGAKNVRLDRKSGSILEEVPDESGDSDIPGVGIRVVGSIPRMNARNFKRFESAFRAYHNTAKQRESMNKTFNESTKARDEYGRRMASDYSAPENEPAEVIGHLWKPMQKLIDINFGDEQRLKSKTMKRSSQSLDIFDPARERQAYETGLDAQIASNEFSQQQNEFQKTVRSSIKEMTDSVAKDAKNGKFFAQCLMFTMSLMSMTSFSAGLSPAGKSGLLKPSFKIGM